MLLTVSETWMIIISISLLILLYISFVLFLVIYCERKYFIKKINEDEIIKNQTYNDFKDLKKETFSFISNKNKINGEIYYYKEKKLDEVIIFSLGFKTTINYYINEIAYFASLGYTVFTYEYCGVGKSEGKKFRGPTQAIIDLNNCIKYFKEENPNSKIILVGHSMGAYASCNVINYQDVNKVIAISPFNHIVKVVSQTIYQTSSRKIFLFPIIYRIVLFFKFGKYSNLKTYETLKRSNIKVLVLHGMDDKTVLVDDCLNSMMTNINMNVKYLVLDNKQHYPLQSSNAINYNLFLKHELSDLKIKYNKKIPNQEIINLNKNINYKLKNEFDKEVLLVVEKFLSEE